MNCYVELKPSIRQTRVEVRSVTGELLIRAKLPALSEVRHHRAATTLLEALSLWLDTRLCVALYAADLERCFGFDVVDALYAGRKTIFYTVEVMSRRDRAADEGQLKLMAKRDGSGQ